MHRAAPSVQAVQEETCQEVPRVVLQAACSYHQGEGKASLQVVSRRRQAVGRGMAASLGEVGHRPCVVVGMVACSGAYHRGLGAYRLAEGKAAFHSGAWGLSRS